MTGAVPLPPPKPGFLNPFSRLRAKSTQGGRFSNLSLKLAACSHHRPFAVLSNMAVTRELPAFLRQTKQEIHNKFVDLEWTQRNRLLQGTKSGGEQSQYSRLQGDEYAVRNRYMNVEPYAANRVKLKVREGMNDYINASPIQLGRRRYIATQGPKDTSVNHFYRMVASELASPAVVVMLTQTHEAGKEKCFQYYPLSAAESPLEIPQDGEIADGFEGKVELVSVEDDPSTRSQHRVMQLRTTVDSGHHQEIEIHHLLFSGWPDFLVPEGEDRGALLRLVRLSADLNARASSSASTGTNGTSTAESSQDNPRIIHCSAGVGRSGTFIALDYLLNLMHTGELDGLAPDKDPIADTVDLLRQQRMMMVQGEAQFFFLYEVMKEQFQAYLKI